MIIKEDMVIVPKKSHTKMLIVIALGAWLMGVISMSLFMQAFSVHTNPQIQNGFEKIDKEKGLTGMTYEQKMKKQTEDSFAGIKKNVQSGEQ